MRLIVHMGKISEQSCVVIESEIETSLLENELQSLSCELVVLLVQNSIENVQVVLACLKLGLPIALLDAGITESEKSSKLELLPSCYLWDEKRYHKNPKNLQLHPETQMILFTSGSSGGAKAVQLSKKNIDANIKAVQVALNFNSIDEQHVFLPLSYSFGLLGQILPALALNKKSFLYQDFTAFFRAYTSGVIKGMISGVPSHHEALLKMTRAPNPNITHIVSAGAKLSTDLRKRLMDAFPNAEIFNNYGQTEASPRMLCYSSKDPQFLEDYVGRPVGDWELSISFDGALEAKGSQVMLGYIDQSKDAQALKQGWLQTGDRAEITESGLVKILGRMDDLIKVAGERLSIGDLEVTYKRLLSHDDLAVITQEDALKGSMIILVIAGTVLSDKEIRAVLEKNCSRQRLPSKIIFQNEIPKLGNGKVDKVTLNQLTQKTVK